MKKILSKILACSFALVIPLTAFLITTNQKNVSASDNFVRNEFEFIFNDTYFKQLDTDSILRGTGSSVQYSFLGSYEGDRPGAFDYNNSPTLNIPSLSNNFVMGGNSFVYDYTLDTTTYYTLTRSKYKDYMVMYAPTPTNHISFGFNNLVLFYLDTNNGHLDKFEFVNALSYYFSFISFVSVASDVNCNITIDGTVADLSAVNKTVNFDTYRFSTENKNVKFTTYNHILYDFFDGLYDYYGDISSNFSDSRLYGDLVNFTGSDVLNYYNSYFILPQLNITFDFNPEIPVNFYLRSKLYDYTLDNQYFDGDYTNLYAYNLYRPDFINTILGYYGYNSFFDGFDIGYNNGYLAGINEGIHSGSPFSVILGTIESFLNFEFVPDFPVYYLILIAFGFAMFGLLVKFALGG